MDFNSIPEALTLPLRLKLICYLVDGKKSFRTLKELTEASDGNISIQLSKLEEWGYVRSEKSFIQKRPKSVYEITQYGLSQLEAYVDLLQTVIQ